jgi:hypothetical protein
MLPGCSDEDLLSTSVSNKQKIMRAPCMEKMEQDFHFQEDPKGKAEAHEHSQSEHQFAGPKQGPRRWSFGSREICTQPMANLWGGSSGKLNTTQSCSPEKLYSPLFGTSTSDAHHEASDTMPRTHTSEASLWQRTASTSTFRRTSTSGTFQSEAMTIMQALSRMSSFSGSQNMGIKQQSLDMSAPHSSEDCGSDDNLSKMLMLTWEGKKNIHEESSMIRLPSSDAGLREGQSTVVHAGCWALQEQEDCRSIAESNTNRSSEGIFPHSASATNHPLPRRQDKDIMIQAHAISRSASCHASSHQHHSPTSRSSPRRCGHTASLLSSSWKTNAHDSSTSSRSRCHDATSTSIRGTSDAFTRSASCELHHGHHRSIRRCSSSASNDMRALLFTRAASHDTSRCNHNNNIIIINDNNRLTGTISRSQSHDSYRDHGEIRRTKSHDIQVHRCDSSEPIDRTTSITSVQSEPGHLFSSQDRHMSGYRPQMHSYTALAAAEHAKSKNQRTRSERGNLTKMLREVQQDYAHTYSDSTYSNVDDDSGETYTNSNDHCSSSRTKPTSWWSNADFGRIKHKWRRAQMHKLSPAASVYGPRGSQRSFWGYSAGGSAVKQDGQICNGKQETPNKDKGGSPSVMMSPQEVKMKKTQKMRDILFRD